MPLWSLLSSPLLHMVCWLSRACSVIHMISNDCCQASMCISAAAHSVSLCHAQSTRFLLAPFRASFPRPKSGSHPGKNWSSLVCCTQAAWGLLSWVGGNVIKPEVIVRHRWPHCCSVPSGQLQCWHHDCPQNCACPCCMFAAPMLLPVCVAMPAAPVHFSSSRSKCWAVFDGGCLWCSQAVELAVASPSPGLWHFPHWSDRK